MITYLHYCCYYYYCCFIYQCVWFIKNVADFQCTQVALSRNWIKCVKCTACRAYLSVTNSLSSKDIVFWKFVELCEMCCRIACTVFSNAEGNKLHYSKYLVGSFLGSLWMWWNSPNWYRILNTSCLLRLSTPIKSNFKALYPSRNRLRALSDAIVLLAGRCYVGQKRQSPARAWKSVHAGRCHAGHSLIDYFNPLNAELNHIRHLLALVGAHRIVHVSRIRVNFKLCRKE